MIHYLFAICLILAPIVSADDHESCACVAAEEGFSLDCSQATALSTAVQFLADNDCEDNCNSACQTQYYILQSHHDWCLSDEIGDLGIVHDYEDACESCHIFRKFDPSLSSCPSVNCSDDDELADVIDYLQAECTTSCSNTQCSDAYQILRSYHDSCEDFDSNIDAEANIHDFEDVCEAQECNSGASDNQTICENDSSVSPASPVSPSPNTSDDDDSSNNSDDDDSSNTSNTSDDDDSSNSSNNDDDDESASSASMITLSVLVAATILI